MPKPNPDPNRKTWRTADVNLIKGTLKERRAEDQRRADAWRATREAELEAVVNRDYDGMDVPGIPELLTELHAVMAPYIEKFDRLFVAAYPAEFAKASIGLRLTPGGIDPKFRDKIRRDAAVHLAARHRFMMANIASHATQTVVNASMHATENPEVRDVLAELATPNATTPTLDAPGPAIGVLAQLLPHPEEWGLAGYESTSPLLPAPEKEAETKVLPAPKKK
jgi:uncharacterized protein (DUF1778 family)